MEKGTRERSDAPKIACPRPACTRNPHTLITVLLHIIMCKSTALNIQKLPAHTRQGHKRATHPNFPVPPFPQHPFRYVDVVCKDNSCSPS